MTGEQMTAEEARELLLHLKRSDRTKPEIVALITWMESLERRLETLDRIQNEILTGELCP